MTNRTRSPENMNESFGPLHRMILDEPLNVWIGVCAPHELEATLSACCELPGAGEVTLVLRLPREVQAANATAIERAPPPTAGDDRSAGPARGAKQSEAR